MANKKILEQKATVINEIQDKMKSSTSFVAFTYQGLSVADTEELRKKLREVNAEFKVYKNTLTKRALDNLNIDLGNHFEGPKAIAFGQDEIGPAKVLSEFAKKHPVVILGAGYIDGKVADEKLVAEYAATPSHETLLAMFASGLMQHAKNFAIGVDLYCKSLEEK